MKTVYVVVLALVIVSTTAQIPGTRKGLTARDYENDFDVEKDEGWPSFNDAFEEQDPFFDADQDAFEDQDDFEDHDYFEEQDDFEDPGCDWTCFGQCNGDQHCQEECTGCKK